MKQRTYIAIDLKSFYASVECRERGLDPLDTNLVVADESRTDIEGRRRMYANGKYDEIIDLPHHVSKTRPQMPMSDRAAQFSPFAVLTGYDSAIRETGRLTDERIELDEEALMALNMRYQLLIDSLKESLEVRITYFKPDERKSGGAYVTVTGVVKKVDDYERLITMQDGMVISMDDVLTIEGEMFSELQ